MSVQWSLVIFTLLTGMAGWALACAAVSELRKEGDRKGNYLCVAIALILMIVGGCASATHLSHPENIMGALSHPTSGIFTEAVLVGVSAVFAIVYLVQAKRDSSSTSCKVAVVIFAAAGVLLSYLAGASYMMSSCPVWDTPLLPLGYLATAIPSGVALYALVGICASESDVPESAWLSWAGLIGAVFALLVGAFYLLPFSENGNEILFASVVLVLGECVAGVGFLLLRRKQANKVAVTVVALVFAAAAALAFRAAMWLMLSPINDFFQMLS